MMEFETSLILVLLIGFTLVSCQKVDYRSYLETAMKMISKAKNNIPACGEGNSYQPNGMQKAMDCADVLRMGYNTSGVYEIWVMNRVTGGKPLKVYCDMDTDDGGWTVIQRRGDFGKPKEYFNKGWRSYKEGFGDVDEDFWLGNDVIFALTNQNLYSVRFDLKDFGQEQRYAVYDQFWIDDENHKYTLHLSSYSGDAGHAMNYSNNQMFSTKDQSRDNDSPYHCAEAYKGGWWFNECTHGNLNGIYNRGNFRHERDGILWFQWRGFDSLRWTEMKIRPTNFMQVKKST